MAKNAALRKKPFDDNRGIQNVGIKTAVDRAKGRLEPGSWLKMGEGRFAANDPRYEKSDQDTNDSLYEETDLAANDDRYGVPNKDSSEMPRRRSGVQAPNSREMLHALKNIRQLFKDAQEELSDADIRALPELKQVQKPSFPYFMFTVALTKDVVDVVVTLTFVGIIVSVALSFLCATILFVWTLLKVSGGGRVQKKLTQRILIKYGLSMGIEFIPGVNVVPTNTIFVLLVYFDETKIGKLFNAANRQLLERGMK